MGLAFVPLYLRSLGAEAFGLVGFMLGLQSISLLLDFGMGVFLNREVARRSAIADTRQTLRDLVRTFEWLVWPIALVLLVAIVAFAGLIAERWFNPGSLGAAEIRTTVMLIGVTVACLWPSSFYASILNGLERQPQLNALVATFATLRYAGVVPFLLWTDMGIAEFVIWHAVVAAAQTAAYGWLAWRSLPASIGRSRFRAGELANARVFALGVFATTGLGLVINQTDRFVVSALRPLQELGYYTAALTVAAGIARLVQPMFAAVYPRMSLLVAANDRKTLRELYHLSSQCLAVLAAPIAVVSCVYAADILFLWTGDAVVAQSAGVPFALLAVGTAINGIIAVPYALMLAHGRTRAAFVGNIVALVLGVPFCILAVKTHGLHGAASLWLLVNLAYLLFLAPFVHREHLPGLSTRWYLHDLVPAVIGASVVGMAAKWLNPSLGRNIEDMSWLAATSVMAVALAALLSSRIRQIAFASARRLVAR